MEQVREEARRRLRELRNIKFAQPTAKQLHTTRPMLSRVHRQEMRIYEQEVSKQKTKLMQDISDINKYLQSVDADKKGYLQLMV